ncbi:MAG: PEP-CTERM sorting domain-containing protein [Syntrophobacteraceae bacterium]
MKKLIILMTLLMAIGFTSTRSEADSITFNLDTVASGSGITSVTSFGTLTFTDNGNFVNLSVNLTNPNYKILAVDLNFDDSKFSNSSVLTLSNQSLDISKNAVKADGYAGKFDIEIPAHGNIGTYGKYSGTMKWNYGFSHLGIADLTFQDTLNQLFAAIHVGNLDGGSSVWLGATSSPVPVSEPGTLLLLGIGLISVALFGKRLKPVPCK